jgi:RNA polymerase sigma-70 factor (ECF subfamily)
LSLAAHFCQHLVEDAARTEPSAELETALAGVLARAKDSWPELPLPTDDFLRHVAERIPPRTDPLASLPDLHAGDLLVAFGCTRGDPGALAIFESRYMARLASYLRRADALPSFTDEVKQAVRVRLLVAEDGLLPRIASYHGRGPLAVWLRLAATRLAIDLRQSDPREAAREDIDDLQAAGADPELAFLKTHYRQELRDAVEGALLSLPPRDGNLLRLHFFEHLSAEIIGAMNGVSARTVQRWLADVRDRIVAETRRRLQARSSLGPAQLDSVIGLVGSQIDLSLTRLFAKISR